MFSGIIRETGRVAEVAICGETARLGVAAKLFEETGPGDSVAVSGVCLTVTAVEDAKAVFDLASETRRVTTLGSLAAGSEVNLERSMRFGERLDGHLVQGHVDAIAEVLQIEEQQNTLRYLFSMAPHIAPFLAPKGSVAVDGVSLTVGEVLESAFSVYIIPYTLQETIFRGYEKGTKVNIETDCIARYVQRLVEPYLGR